MPNTKTAAQEFIESFYSGKNNIPCIGFFKENKMFIKKMIDGVWVTKEAARDPHYNGNRYDWVENIKPN